MRPVCMQCSIEMICKRNGAEAVEMAFDPPQPYKGYRADIWQCPVCENKVVLPATHPQTDYSIPGVLPPDFGDEDVFPVYERGDKCYPISHTPDGGMSRFLLIPTISGRVYISSSNIVEVSEKETKDEDNEEKS